MPLLIVIKIFLITLVKKVPEFFIVASLVNYLEKDFRILKITSFLLSNCLKTNNSCLNFIYVTTLNEEPKKRKKHGRSL